MTRDEAGKLLGETIKELVVHTPTEDYRVRQKMKLLESKLTENGFPFQDRNVMEELIPLCKTWTALYLDEALKSDGAGSVLFGRSADMFRVAGEMFKKKILY